MKPLSFLAALTSLLAGPALAAVQSANERPPVFVAESRAQPPDVGSVDHAQRRHAPGVALVEPAQVGEIVARFREAYEKAGRPRLVVAVNRELVEMDAGLRLAARAERVEIEEGEVTSDFTPTGAPAPAEPGTEINIAVGGSAGRSAPRLPLAKGQAATQSKKTVAENTYKDEPRTGRTLADRQTVRDLERLFGRPLRAGGASLVDQRVVASLLADKPVDYFIGGADDVARKDREALAASADAVLEILVSSRTLTTAGLSGEENYDVPDIQATVVRLKDGVILAQASSADVLGKDRFAGPIVRMFDVNDIAEATALALMEDFAATTP